MRGLLIGIATLVIALSACGVALRLAVKTNPGRAMVVRILDGVQIGPLGTLHVSGLGGDVFAAFGLKDLSINDAQGRWLDVKDLTIVWSPLELLGRRVHLTYLGAKLLTVLRQPVLIKEPPQKPSKPLASIILDKVTVRLQTAPAVSVRAGLWDVLARVDLHRNGKIEADASAKSLLHAGDGAALALKVGRRGLFRLRADVIEAGGGALAGAMGLPETQSLRVHADGDGGATQGGGRLSARSGSTTPLLATVQWSRLGVSAHATVSLGASRWLRFFAERLGPEAQVTLMARQTQSDVYALDAGLAAKDGALRVQGPVNWKTQTSSGLGVSLDVADLSKWIAMPKIGAATVKGAVTGGSRDFQFKGAFDGRKLDQFGYALDHISGPANLAFKGGEWRLQADLLGAGGNGKGVAANVIGPTPRVKLDLSALKDGHWLFHVLNVDGAGVKIAAQGGQGLLGGMSFKGSAQLLSLAAFHPGAKGGMEATWDARSNSAQNGWDFDFDAKAAGFASGVSDLDHFLGQTPHLSAKGLYGQAGLIISNASLAGLSAQATGKGALDPHQAVSADFEWTAKGPITAGPLEIAGAAKGSGKLSGALATPRADLVADLSSLDLGQLVVAPAKLTVLVQQDAQGVSGTTTVSGPTAAYGHADAKADFKFAGDGVQLSHIAAVAGGVNLSGALSLHSGEPSAADLHLVAGPGAFLQSGRLAGQVKIVDAPSGAQADLALTGSDVQFMGAAVMLHSLNLTAHGPFNALPFALSANATQPAPWRFSGKGVLDHSQSANTLTLQGDGRIRQADFKFLQPAVIHFGGAEQSLQGKLAIAGGQAEIDAHAQGQTLKASADFSHMAIASFSDDFAGALSGTLNLEGRDGRLEGSLNAALTGARSRDAPVSEGLSTTLKASLSQARLNLEANATNAEGLKATGSIDLPVESSVTPFRLAIDRTKAVRGSFSADGEIRPLWDVFAGGERTLSGHLATSGLLQGSLNDFKATGQGTLAGAKFRDVSTGLALQNLDVDTTFGDNALTVRHFSGGDVRGGTVSGDGRVSFAQDGASTFTLNLKRFQLIDNDLGRATASGAVTVTHPAKGQGKLSGQLIIDRADIVAATPTPTGVVPMEVVELHQPVRDGQDKPQPAALGPPILMDVTIKAARGVYVKGKGLNVELSLDSHVGGSISQPDLTGVARVVGGSYDFAGKRFDMDSSGQVRLGANANQIRLNLSATWEDPTLTAVVRVQGTAAKPEITLTSTPVLPQDEVLSRVLFGVSAAQLSAAQGAELASALASLSGGGGFDVIGNLRQFAGLDRLALGGTSTTGTTISGGKYLNKDVYVELTGGGRNGSGAQLEWRIRHDLSLVSRYGAALDPRYSNDTDASLSIRFRKDF